MCYFVLLQFDCCGVDNFHDFDGATKWNRTADIKIPETCCKASEETKEKFYDNPSSFKPDDPKCQTIPTSTNSNQNTVIKTLTKVHVVYLNLFCLYYICLIFLL